MKKNVIVALLIVILSALSIKAQSYRLTDLSNRLATQSENLAERAYNNYASRDNNNRTDFDNMMLGQELSAAANIFRRLVQDRRRETDLRPAAEFLSDLSRRFPSYGDSNLFWRDARRTIDDLTRELQIGNGNNNDPNDGSIERENRDIVGRVRWRGTVDDEVQLFISGSSIDARTISGTTFPAGSFNFTSPLPSNNRRLTIEVNKIKGRGNVRVMQQPNRDNNFTGVVQIKDSGNGAKEYELDIYWTR